MTIKTSGSLSLQEINTEFGLGNFLGAYRGSGRFNSSNQYGTFSSGAIDFQSFYNTSKQRRSPRLVASASSSAVRPAWSVGSPDLHVANYESLAYLGIATSSSSSSRSFGSFTWDGGASDYTISAIDNTDSEHKGMAYALKNVDATDYDKTMLAGFTSTSTQQANIYFNYALIGGTGTYGVVTANARGSSPGYPFTYNYSLLKNDIVICSQYARIPSGGDFNVSGTEYKYSASGFTTTFRIIPSDGAYSFTLTSSGQSQQWVDIMIVLRGSGFSA